MVPTLLPGQEFIANSARHARRNDVVAVPHPNRHDFWLVKRVVALAGDTVQTPDGLKQLDAGEAWVRSDNALPGVVDSDTFGPVDARQLQPVVDRLDADTFRAAIELLIGEDPALRATVERHGEPTFWSRQRGFASLVILILEQQVSLDSAAAVYRRLRRSLGDVTPERISSQTVTDLNRLGITRQKAGYLLNLADAVASADLDLTALSDLSVEDARNQLLAQRGIGSWTADAYLLSAEGRPDIFPIGDRALQVGISEALGLGSIPLREEMELLSAPWRPIRSVAAQLLWHGYLSRRGRSEPVHD